MTEESNASWGSNDSNNNAHMTNAQVVAARQLRHDFNMTVQELATMYGISRGCMSLVLRGKTYANVDGPIDPGRKTPQTPPLKGKSRAGKRDT
jgi:hypothetical protein